MCASKFVESIDRMMEVISFCSKNELATERVGKIAEEQYIIHHLSQQTSGIVRLLSDEQQAPDHHHFEQQ